ncbi:receptor-type tyrosine-protein phosphatase kappa [Trichonephila clavipes]|nr:receptor-type tyrosine-protein phosphatase kappa [Trichonephila clavipes]
MSPFQTLRRWFAGYLRSKEFIVTEWPMQHTVPDFWSLVYDHDCNSIVVLCDHPPSSNYPQFYPSEKEKSKKFGPVFTIETVSYSTLPNIKSWIFKILKKVVSLTELMSGVKAEPKTTQLFFITCWPAGHKVPTSTNSLVELMNMVERWRQRTSYGPVLLVSSNGRARVGVYCAASIAIEQAIEHEEVDVFTAVKVVRRHRPQLVENITEYKYCYDLLLNYIMNFHHKEIPTQTLQHNKSVSLYRLEHNGAQESLLRDLHEEAFAKSLVILNQSSTDGFTLQISTQHEDFEH